MEQNSSAMKEFRSRKADNTMGKQGLLRKVCVGCWYLVGAGRGFRKNVATRIEEMT